MSQPIKVVVVEVVDFVFVVVVTVDIVVVVVVHVVIFVVVVYTVDIGISGWGLGSRLAKMLVAPISDILFLFFPPFPPPPHFSPIIFFSHRRSALIKKLIEQKLMEVPKNLSRLHWPFGAPSGHF